MNKTCYRNFHAYTEAKSEFILSEELKTIKMNKISDTKKSECNITGAANAGNNKSKHSKQNKKY